MALPHSTVYFKRNETFCHLLHLMCLMFLTVNAMGLYEIDATQTKHGSCKVPVCGKETHSCDSCTQQDAVLLAPSYLVIKAAFLIVLGFSKQNSSHLWMKDKYLRIIPKSFKANWESESFPWLSWLTANDHRSSLHSWELSRIELENEEGWALVPAHVYMVLVVETKFQSTQLHDVRVTLGSWSNIM